MTTMKPAYRIPCVQNAIFGVNPVETDAVRKALVTAYNALLVLCDPRWGSATIGLADNDPMSVEQGQEAIKVIEESMSPNLLATVLETYSRVRFQTDKIDRPMTGLVREGAWGTCPDRGEQALERRITMDSGFEFFVNPDTVFTYFEVMERGERR